MKKIFSKIMLLGIAVLSFTVLSSCNPELEVKQFSVTFKEAGPGYVTMMATVPYPTTISYILSEKPMDAINETILNAAGKKVTFYSDGEQQLLHYELKENTHYYLYMVALLSESELSQMYKFEFDTQEFVFTQLATVVGVLPDGFKMHLQMPESVLSTGNAVAGSRAIRYSHCSLMMYNLRSDSSDDYEHLLWNGGNHIRESKTLLWNDESNYGEVGYDANEDGEIDSNDKGMLWDPIAPGEPVVFVAGEFEWMQEPWHGKDSVEKAEMIQQYQKEHNLPASDDNYVVNGFYYPAGWDPGYYLPCLDSTKYWSLYSATKGAGIIKDLVKTSEVDYAWTGKFQRKLFRTRIPDVLNSSIKVTVEDLKSVDATVFIEPGTEIYRYLFTILDDASYQYMLKLLDGREEYVQWAVTSYFAMMEFGALEVAAGANETTAPIAKINLSDFFYTVPSDTKYHVLVTGMSGDIGSPQCFHHHTFSTPAKTKDYGPDIEVTALPDLATPYSAVFNVKCNSTSSNPLVTCYYGANYYKDWVLDVNSGSSYETLGQSVAFTADEIEQICSPEGYTMYIPSIDGAKTRLVVVGWNDENISNGVDTYEDVLAHPAVADCVTPYAVAEDLSLNPLLDPMSSNGNKPLLNGEWTLTATVKTFDGKEEVQKSKVRIKNALVEGIDYPENLPDSVMTIYKEETKWSEEQIKDYFDNFKTFAESYNTNRLRNQCKLVLEGWMDNDTLDRLSVMTPWDMFISRDVNVVDVESLFTEYGPKMYIKVNKDKNGRDSLALTANKYFASPVANWSVPFYLAGYANQEVNNTMFYWGSETQFEAPLEFPVTLSENKDTLTIKGYMANGSKFYPNVIGVDEGTLYGTQYILQQPIVSDVVLTRGWNEDEVEPAPATRASWGMRAYAVSPIGKPNLVKFSKRTVLMRPEQSRVQEIDYKFVPYEQLQKNLEKYKTRK